MSIIEVAGCIASGKTTLVQALSGTFANAIYEDHTINPFWSAFYTNPSLCAFETEITFLLQHYHFLKITATQSEVASLLDHSFELDMAYAEIGLHGDRKRIFDSIYEEIRKELGYPDAVIYIKCSPKEMLRRIQTRGRSFEKNISLEFVSNLCDKLHQRISWIPDDISIVKLDSEVVDFRNDGPWQCELRRLLSEL